MTTEIGTPTARRLTQRGAATALGLGLVAIPGLPAVVDEILPPRQWDTVTLDEHVDVTTAEGVSIVAEPPPDWKILDMGASALVANGDAHVSVSAVDLDGRDPGDVTQRLIRLARVGGVYAALDGGTVASADGVFTGPTCVVVTADATGTCAYLSDGDVLVSLVSLAEPGSTALPVTGLAETLAKGDA